MLEALGFFALVEVVGLAAVPLAGLVFGRLPGAGLGFAKPLGLLLLTWAVWMAVSLGIVSYSTATVVGAAAGLAVAGALAALRQRALAARRDDDRGGWWARRRAGRIAVRALPRDDPARRPLWLGSEIVFAVAFAAMALLVAYSPDVWGTEKPMDMAFVAATNASASFPPHDPWMAGEDLNYYYLGHLAMAMAVKVMGTAPDEGYNLAFALLGALTATAVFTLAGTLWAAARPSVRGGPVTVGVAAVVVCLVLGNLAGVRAWIDARDPPGDYDWFAPSRVIPDTISEFPSFSLILQDLHAHVLALPFTLVALAFALQVVLAGPRGDALLRGVAEALAAALAIGFLYAVNSWSYPVAAGLLVLAVAAWARSAESRGRRGYAAVWLAIVLLASVVLVLPFWLEFDPAARGIALVEERASFGEFMGDNALIYGVLAWPLTAALAARLLATRRPWRTAVWSAVAAIFAGSLLAPVDLTGAAAVAALLAVALAALFSTRLGAGERFLWLLVAGAATCVLLPELVYVRDEFEGGVNYRMNTVFKLGYQGCAQHGGDRGADEQHQPEENARDVRGVSAQGAQQERDPQSENVCSHSRPSTSLRPPASSMKRCSSVSSPRTSSTVPSASTWPATITATREQTRSTSSMPWLERITVPPCATYVDEDVEDDRARDRIDRLEGLVEHEQPRRVDHGAGEHDLLHHAGGVVRHDAAERIRRGRTRARGRWCGSRRRPRAVRAERRSSGAAGAR